MVDAEGTEEVGRNKFGHINEVDIRFFHDLIKVTKNFITGWQAWLRHNMKGITRNINKPKMTLKTFYIPFLFKPIECMDTIRVVQFLYYKLMMGILCLKPSSFCTDEPSLYPRNVVGILITLIFLGVGVFLNNHNNVVFTWILCMIYITCPNMGNDVLTFL